MPQVFKCLLPFINIGLEVKAFINSTAENIIIHIIVWTLDLISVGYVLGKLLDPKGAKYSALVDSAK